MTTREEARNGLLMMVSVLRRVGHMAPDIADQARGFVDALAPDLAPKKEDGTIPIEKLCSLVCLNYPCRIGDHDLGSKNGHCRKCHCPEPRFDFASIGLRW